MKLFFLFFLSALPFMGIAQNEETQVIQVVKQFFAGMKNGDRQLTEKCLDENLRLTSVVVNSAGETAVIEESRDTLLLLIGTPHNEIWDERISSIQVRIDGGLAVVTCDYEFYVGERYSHRGLDVFELVRLSDGWRIISITDTRRK